MILWLLVRSSSVTFSPESSSSLNFTESSSRVLARILVGLCTADLINSILWIFWSLPIPQGTPGVWGALGNDATCRMSAFFHQLGSVGAYYNGALCHYYLERIRNGKKEDEFRQGYEWKWHIVAVGVPGLTAAIGLLVEDAYAFVDMGCWFGGDGPRTYLFGWLLQGVPLSMLLMFITYCVWEIHRHVKETVERQFAHSFRHMTPSELEAPAEENPSVASPSSTTLQMPSSGSPGHRRQSASSQQSTLELLRVIQETRTQAYLYVGAFAITHAWAYLVYSLHMANHPLFFASFLMNFFWPLQGFLNVWIFFAAALSIDPAEKSRAFTKTSSGGSYF